MYSVAAWPRCCSLQQTVSCMETVWINISGACFYFFLVDMIQSMASCTPFHLKGFPPSQRVNQQQGRCRHHFFPARTSSKPTSHVDFRLFIQSLLALCIYRMRKLLFLKSLAVNFPRILFGVLKQSGLHSVGYLNKPFTYTKYSWLHVSHSAEYSLICVCW